MTRHSPASPLIQTTIGTIPELETHAAGLADLWRRSEATAFQHPGWWLPWARVFAPCGLDVLLVSADEQLIAVLPMYVAVEGATRVWRFLGCGIGDYLDAVVDTEHLEAAVPCLTGWLEARAGAIDASDLPPGSVFERAAASCRRRVETSPCATCPVVTLPADARTWRAHLPHGLRRNIERYDRKLSALAETAFETAHAGTIDEFVEAFFVLHAARWGARGEPGVLADGAVEPFHREAIPRLFDAGVARLHGIRHGGRLAAVQYVLEDARTAWSYLAGFDPALAAYSPGTLLMAYSIERAIEDGCTRFDLLRGDEPYKATWTDTRVHTTRCWLPADGRGDGR